MIKKVSEKQKEKNKLKSQTTKELHLWFLEMWDKREENDGNGDRYVICFESGQKLHRSLYRKNSCCYSHLLPKAKYKHLAMVEENLVIVHPLWHEKHTTPKQDELRNKLKEKYG
jgi:hypothetical protein